MTFRFDGTDHRAPAGAFVFIPRGILHTFWNASDALARQLIVFTPAGIEDYFDDVSQALAAGGETALAAAEALMAHHDMSVPEDRRSAYGSLSTAQD